MKKVRTKVRAKLAEHISRRKLNARELSPGFKFAVVAIAMVVGYAAGTYHLQIEAAIGPVFGYKSHSGTIDLSSVQETYSKLAANYDGKLDTKALIEGANEGMVNAVGDAYTVYMGSKESAAFDDALAGKVGGGIGAEINIRNSKVTIIRALEDNPAIRAGLKAGDVIVKINDESTEGWSVDQAVTKIRGEEGTTVKLLIQRGTETKEYTITRAIINNPSVYSSVTDGVGKMTITRFDSETGDLARLAAQDFKSQNVKSVILDLRDNSGGYIDAARDVAGLWLENKVIVTERSSGLIRESLRSGDDAILAGIPTMVLVNGESASASEIVAGALKDYGVAKLVGLKTFGKGSVQELIQLDNGGTLKVTIARWYTPKGKNINKDGIEPDYSVNLTQEDSDNGVDPQLDKANELLKS